MASSLKEAWGGGGEGDYGTHYVNGYIAVMKMETDTHTITHMYVHIHAHKHTNTHTFTQTHMHVHTHSIHSENRLNH